MSVRDLSIYIYLIVSRNKTINLYYCLCKLEHMESNKNKEKTKTPTQQNRVNLFD